MLEGRCGCDFPKAIRFQSLCVSFMSSWESDIVIAGAESCPLRVLHSSSSFCSPDLQNQKRSGFSTVSRIQKENRSSELWGKCHQIEGRELKLDFLWEFCSSGVLGSERKSQCAALQGMCVGGYSLSV